jgi:ferredoxin-type protein NapH
MSRRFLKGGVLAPLTLAVSLLSGVPLFEIFSPMGALTRAIMFAVWPPLILLLAIVAVEVTLAPRVWCRSLCPVGGFYSLLGRFSPVRVGFKLERCTACGDCTRICPVDEVLAPSLDNGARQVVSGHGTRCGACIDACAPRPLVFDTRYKK